MTSPPGARPNSQTTFRGAAKQARESEGGGGVRVFSVTGFLVARLHQSRDAGQIRRLLAAPNSVAVRTNSGRLAGIRLLSFGDDRGRSGERHGRSTVTTERVRNDAAQYVGSEKNVKHKEICKAWGSNIERTNRDCGGDYR